MGENPERAVDRLVGLLSSGDPGAVHALLERYLGDLHAYVARHAGDALQLREAPEDMVQSVCREVLEGVQRGAFTYRGEAEFRQWLYQAALHKIQMRARYFAAERRGQERETPLAALDDSRGELPLGTTRTPSRSAVAREEHERFVAALRQLPAEQQRLIEWAHFEGLGHREIASRLGVSEANSRMMLSRALARLARIATHKPGPA